MRTIKPSRSVAILAALVLVTAMGQAGSAATRPDHEVRNAAAGSNCDPNDLPGQSEGPDDDGDECNFTIFGVHHLPKPSQQPEEFAEGSPDQAKKCNIFLFGAYHDLGEAAATGMSKFGAPTGAAWLRHFLDGNQTVIQLGDDSPLAAAVKSSSVFRNYDKAVQTEIKKDLDSGEQNVVLNAMDKTSSIYTTPDFTSLGNFSDPRWAFGGTQGLVVTGNGFPQHGQYVGELTYTISDVYGFYEHKKGELNPQMHYLQSTCGAPSFKGGAHWFYDSVIVKVKFQQPIG